MYRILGCLLVLASGAAHAGTMSFQLENAGTISGYLTLSGTGITINQSTYNSSTLSNYNISLVLDYGQGPIEFAVTGGNFRLQNSTSTPTAYTAYGTDLLLSETVTNPGNTTGWRLVQYLDTVPGIPNDDILRLTNLSTNVVYESVYPDAGHIWRLTPARVPTISINVQPWDNTNTINPTANNQVIVALFSTQIAANEDIDFDASQVDSNTVTFGPLQAGKTGSVWFTDLDQDSDTDLLLNFSNLNAGFLCEDSEAVVEGRRFSGDYFVGADFITTPACVTDSCHNDPAPARDTGRSPQRVVFLAKHPTNYPDEAHLYSVADNGSALIELSPPTPNSYADPVISYFIISPDKKWVAYQRSWYDINYYGNLSELYVSAIDGSSRVKVSGAMVSGATIAAGSFKWAPDSSRIAFVADAFTDNVMELFVVNRDGTNRVRINGTLPTGGDVFAFDWAPNSSQLAYSGDQTVDVYSEIWVAAADGSARQKVSATALPSGTGGTSPRWSPDGNKILYQGTLFTPGVWQLFTVNSDGTSHAQISGPMVAGGGLYAPALNPWSGDSTQVLYYADQQTDETYELFAAAADGSGNVKVNGTLAVNADVPCCENFSWSPDSNYVSYTANQSNVVDAFLWNRTTGTRTVLDSAGPTTVLHNAWSPNGQRLAFFGDKQSSQSNVEWRKLYIANNNGGNATLASGTMSSGGSFANYVNLVFNLRSYRPAWSPDSSRYLYAADKNIDGVLELFAANADGSRNIKVSEAVATGTGVDGRGFGWSSDGKKVTYIQDVGGMFSLFSNDSVGGTPIKLSDDLLVQGTAINYAGPTY